jgi:hypothetical protein
MILNLLDDASGNADTNNPKTPQDVGLAFTLGRGYSLVWSGWDSGAARANNGMTARLPPALEHGEPMVRRIRDEFHIGTRAPGKGDVARLNYPAVSIDQRNARLTVRDRESDSRTEIPALSWEFVDPQSIRLLLVGTRFEPYLRQTVTRRRCKCAQRSRFAPDSLLEGDGFEPSVPGAKEPVLVGKATYGDRNGGIPQKVASLTGYRGFESISLHR